MLKFIGYRPSVFALAAILAVPAAPLSAQELDTAPGDVTVYGSEPTEGPKIEGVIVARSGEQLRIATENGTNEIAIDDQTSIRAKGGFLGILSTLSLCLSVCPS